jgi:hypothetical protein
MKLRGRDYGFAAFVVIGLAITVMLFLDSLPPLQADIAKLGFEPAMAKYAVGAVVAVALSILVFRIRKRL